MPNTLIKSTLDIDVPPAQETANDTVTTCTYLGATTVIVRLSTDEDATSFGQGRRNLDEGGQPTTDVAGLGDEAYYSSVEFGDIVTNTLVARRGPVQVQVAAVASLDAEKDLVGKIFTALH